MDWIISQFTDTYSYIDYITRVLSKTNKLIEYSLYEKLTKAMSIEPRVHRKLSASEEVFKIKAYILGLNIKVSSRTGVELPIRIAANPSILVNGKEALLFIRASSIGSHPIPNPWSRTFIIKGSMNLEKLKGNTRVEAEPILYPLISTERVEDPRAYKHNSNAIEVYHVRAIKPYEDFNNIKGNIEYVVTFKALLKDNNVLIEPTRFIVDEEEYILHDYRDTFPLNNKYMVVRPWLKDRGIGGIIIAPRKDCTVDLNEAIIHRELLPTSIERKTGGNYAVKISSNEYILFFHSVDRIHGTYHTYAAILDSEGELLGITPQPIISPRPHDYIGARPATIFICGAQILGDKILVSAGKDDEITLIMEAELEKLLAKIKYIKG